MRNIFKKSLLILVACLLASTIGAQTTVIWTPTEADVTALTNQSVHYVDVGSGTQSFKVYSTRPFFNNNQVKLEWDASANAIKMTDNGIDKAGLAIYIPANSDDVQQITVYMHTTGSRKTSYANGQTCPNSGTSTTSAIAKTSTAYNFWSAPFQKDWYYVFGGRKDGSGESYYDKIEVVFAGPAGPSTDATLKTLTYNGTSVTGFSADKTSYEVELPAGTTSVPAVAATASDGKATVSVTQADKLPGTAKVTVTAEDGTTVKEYTITFTVASAAPKVLSATWDNMKGTAVVDNVNNTVTGEVKNGTPLTAITPQFTGNNIKSWTPQGAQDFSKGAVTYIFSAPTGEAISYDVTITEGAPVSDDATLKSLSISGYTISFSPTTYEYNVELKSGTTIAPNVSYAVNDSKATATKTDATGVPGVTKIVVTAEDGSKQTYTIIFSVAVPSSDLTVHEPGIYEEKDLAGGYNGKLSVFNGREYEVYYATFDSESNYRVSVTPAQKTEGITESIATLECKANDGWFTVKGANSKSNYSGAQTDEFAAGEYGQHKIYNDGYYKLQIKGYDQFSFFARDNTADASKGKYFKVFIDGIEQPANQLSSSDKIRRYDISTGKHLIEVRGVGGSNNYFYGFSLRVAQEPRVNRVKGDMEQTVLQTTSMKDITFFTKYNKMGETRIVWDGSEGSGMGLRIGNSNALGDTIIMSGKAMCPVGEYPFHVVSLYNGNETSRISGKITVTSDIKATSDVNVDVYQNEEMDQITFTYYALTADDVKLTWTKGEPQGTIKGQGDNGKYIIGGTPTATGTYPFEITVLGADTVIKGQITVKILDYGDNAVLYLYKNNLAYEKDGVFSYLSSNEGGKRNLIARKAKEDGLRPAAQYANYKWILISEDVDANNAEVLAVARGEAGLPVLNMKSFSYAPYRLDWGEPNNGSISENGKSITVLRGDHPIFKALGKKQGDKIVVLDSIIGKGLMPAAVVYDSTLCLATALTRPKNDYYGDGEEETFLHEVPASLRGGKKYICLPIGISSTKELSADGKQLLKETVNYLLNSQPTVTVPQLEITSFKIGNYSGTIDQDNNKITVNIEEKEQIDLSNVQPEITLNSILTHVTPNSGETVDLSDSHYGLDFVVSDYIHRRVYNVVVALYRAEGIDNVYTTGEWVNIYDIHGRKITTTNEDVYQMALPTGVYIISTANGTFKITK